MKKVVNAVPALYRTREINVYIQMHTNVMQNIYRYFKPLPLPVYSSDGGGVISIRHTPFLAV